MSCFGRPGVVLVGLIALGAACAPAFGQARGYRRIVPWVEQTIPLDRDADETVSTHDIVELLGVPNLKWAPVFAPESRTLYAMAADVKFRRPVKGLEITFKPLRMIEVDIPQPTGKMQRTLIWYMVYRVTNRGGHLVPQKNDDGTYTTTTEDSEFRFFPSFVLEAHKQHKAYLDRVIPAAQIPIQNREDPNRRLLNSVEISARPIPVSTPQEDRSVWCVVTWQDVDPLTDFFSIYIQGLTDAYKWNDPAGVYKHGDPLGKGRQFVYKTLKLNFWRPGDEYQEHEGELIFGIPPGEAELYGSPEGVDYEWVYR